MATLSFDKDQYGYEILRLKKLIFLILMIMPALFLSLLKVMKLKIKIIKQERVFKKQEFLEGRRCEDESYLRYSEIDSHTRLKL